MLVSSLMIAQILNDSWGLNCSAHTKLERSLARGLPSVGIDPANLQEWIPEVEARTDPAIISTDRVNRCVIAFNKRIRNQLKTLAVHFYVCRRLEAQVPDPFTVLGRRLAADVSLASICWRWGHAFLSEHRTLGESSNLLSWSGKRRRVQAS